MSDILKVGQHALASQPFSVLLGFELTRFEVGRADFRLIVKPEHGQQHGFAHGGLVATIADNALAFAGGSVLGNVVTQEMKVNFIRPAIGEVLIARGIVVSSGRSQAVCRADVFAVRDGEEKLCAAAQGTIVPVPKA